LVHVKLDSLIDKLFISDCWSSCCCSEKWRQIGDGTWAIFWASQIFWLLGPN